MTLFWEIQNGNNFPSEQFCANFVLKFVKAI